MRDAVILLASVLVLIHLLFGGASATAFDHARITDASIPHD